MRRVLSRTKHLRRGQPVAGGGKGGSLVAQWLGFWAFTAVVQVQFSFGELGSCKLWVVRNLPCRVGDQGAVSAALHFPGSWPAFCSKVQLVLSDGTASLLSGKIPSRLQAQFKSNWHLLLMPTGISVAFGYSHTKLRVGMGEATTRNRKCLYSHALFSLPCNI